MLLQLWSAASVIYYHTDQLSWMIENFHKVKTAKRNYEQSKVLSPNGEVGKFAVFSSILLFVFNADLLVQYFNHISKGIKEAFFQTHL